MSEATITDAIICTRCGDSVAASFGASCSCGGVTYDQNSGHWPSGRWTVHFGANTPQGQEGEGKSE